MADDLRINEELKAKIAREVIIKKAVESAKLKRSYQRPITRAKIEEFHENRKLMDELGED